MIKLAFAEQGNYSEAKKNIYFLEIESPLSFEFFK
jgi:hypothetical protein